MRPPAPKQERPALGVLLMALAVMFFTCIDTSAKWLMMAGLPPLQVVFCRYLGHFLTALVVFLPTEGPGLFRSANWKLQFLRSSFLLGSTILNFTALSYLPITVNTTIQFAGPIMITLLSIPLLGEKVGISRVLAVCIGFVGVLIVMQPWGAQFHPAMFLILAALVCSSLYFILTRKLAGRERNATHQVWGSGVAVIALLPFVLSLWRWPDSMAGWAVMIVIGIFGALGHISATRAHGMADASLLAPIVYLQLLFASIAGVLVFSTWPTIWTLIGGLVIIGSGLFIWHRERLQPQ
ncbi:MAG TPA: EamA/RhaT family transporter [Rhodobacteraceae bacterium]|jgi:drug/metabolite transporter (DMT)-like permease|nr:EamA/RhaT family transporter [Paracoccaceae bacterium]